MSATIRVDIWSDIACPWCYIGKHRFERGVRAFRQQHPDVDFEVEGHSYELAPDTPEGFTGNEIDFLIKHKGMAREHVEQMLGQMTELAASEGIEMNFERVKHANTHRSHRVLHLAQEQGLYSEMLERVFRAYFAEGQDVTDAAVLAALGEEVGLDEEEVRDALDSDARGEAVEADITRARMLGVSGVPFFLINSTYGVSGAQSPESFVSVLEQVLELEAQDA